MSPVIEGIWAWLEVWGPTLTLVSGGFGVVSLVVTLIAMPRILAGLPEDYLVRERHAVRPDLHVWLLRNGVGWPLVVLGIVLMPLPGQGMLTVLAGVVLADVPGKSRVLRAILRRGPLASAVDAIRARQGAPPLRRF